MLMLEWGEIRVQCKVSVMPISRINGPRSRGGQKLVFKFRELGVRIEMFFWMKQIEFYFQLSGGSQNGDYTVKSVITAV